VRHYSAQSQVETPEGTDIEDVNERRDAVWQEWCEVCDVNGRLNFAEIQQLAQREIVEAGEVLIHLVNTPAKKYRGIYRPVPFAIELIEADRLATEKDTYKFRDNGNNKIVRGVELDDLGKPVAYWIYPEHPNSGPMRAVGTHRSDTMLPIFFTCTELIESVNPVEPLGSRLSCPGCGILEYTLTMKFKPLP
jgi:capsid protein